MQENFTTKQKNTPKGTSSFQGFQRPKDTAIPNEIFDKMLPELDGSELKVLLYICRHTFGYDKISDKISHSQIANGITTAYGKVVDWGTGISPRQVIRIIVKLEKKNMVMVHRVVRADGNNEPNTYSLKFDEEVETPHPQGGSDTGDTREIVTPTTPWGSDMDVSRVVTPMTPTSKPTYPSKFKPVNRRNVSIKVRHKSDTN